MAENIKNVIKICESVQSDKMTSMQLTVKCYVFREQTAFSFTDQRAVHCVDFV